MLALLSFACDSNEGGAFESQLCVVRHAEAFKNLTPPPEGLTPSQLDALTPNGESQARAAGTHLPRRVGVLASSPANRAQQTARGLGLDVEVAIDPALRALDGDLPWDARVAAWSRGDDPRPDGGESLADGAARVRALLTSLRARVRDGEHAVLVTHGDIAALVIGELRGTALLERPSRHELGTAQVACLPLGG
ncbi:MAG: histidine phosphatase family protein [Myxococcota bacterium]|nr:histidine phosphatase family protein [Myxococcota bacterium]